jgi:hypothetical protein
MENGKGGSNLDGLRLPNRPSLEFHRAARHPFPHRFASVAVLWGRPCQPRVLLRCAVYLSLTQGSTSSDPPPNSMTELGGGVAPLSRGR